MCGHAAATGMDCKLVNVLFSDTEYPYSVFTKVWEKLVSLPGQCIPVRPSQVVPP